MVRDLSRDKKYINLKKHKIKLKKFINSLILASKTKTNSWSIFNF